MQLDHQQYHEDGNQGTTYGKLLNTRQKEIAGANTRTCP